MPTLSLVKLQQIGLGKEVYKTRAFILDSILSQMKVALLCLLLLTAVLCEDEGSRRTQELRELSRKSSNHIIKFDARMFNEYAKKFPRPYVLVIYFTSQNCRLCTELEPDYEYLANLYAKAGLIQQAKNPIFFVELQFNSENKEIFKIFEFNTAPNLAILKPKFATLSETALPKYLKGFIWSISYSDGHVTTHKMLDFVNKRAGVDVLYKPTFGMMLTTISVFLAVCAIGVLAYTKLKFFWMRWQVWFAGVLIIYITCVSGVVYDVLQGVPFVSRDDKGNAVIFSSGGSRYQNGAEGLVVSLIISSIGVMLVLVPKIFSSLERNKARFVSIGLVLGVYALVKFLEEVYRMKSWYNPMYNPPGDYMSGWFLKDQGNNI